MNQELIEKLQELKRQIRDASSTHSIRHLGGRAVQIAERLKAEEGESEEYFERKKQAFYESINLTLDRETNWADYSASDSRKKKSKVSSQKAVNDLQHAIQHLADDIDNFIDDINEKSEKI